MIRNNRRGCVFGAVALMALAGCDRAPLQGPPELRLGRDECRECGMIISEDRCSSALLLERAGRREYALFDDLGCMLDVERAGLDGAAVIERHVHDYAGRGWLAAESAVYLLTPSDKLVTPMASGMVAFADRSAAQLAQAAHGGELLDYRALGEARRAWYERRRQSAGG